MFGDDRIIATLHSFDSSHSWRLALRTRLRLPSRSVGSGRMPRTLPAMRLCTCAREQRSKSATSTTVITVGRSRLFMIFKEADWCCTSPPHRPERQLRSGMLTARHRSRHQRVDSGEWPLDGLRFASQSWAILSPRRSSSSESDFAIISLNLMAIAWPCLVCIAGPLKVSMMCGL